MTIEKAVQEKKPNSFLSRCIYIRGCTKRIIFSSDKETDGNLTHETAKLDCEFSFNCSESCRRLLENGLYHKPHGMTGIEYRREGEEERRRGYL